MTKSQPANDAPVALRAATQLSGPPAPRAATWETATNATVPTPVREEAVQGFSFGGEDLTVATLAMFGVLGLAGGGWLVRRRRQLAQGPQQQPEAPVPDRGPEPSQLWAPDSNTAFNSGWATATPPRSRPASRIGVAAQKRLIKWLMWLRTVTGAVAILAAIAIVVFWSIEAIDRAGETGLTIPLLVLLLAGCVTSWGSGQLANALHRSFFGRVHPKFDT